MNIPDLRTRTIASLIAVPILLATPVLAQTDTAPHKPAAGSAMTVTGTIMRINAGVITLVGGQQIFTDAGTHIVGPQFSVPNRITVTGTRVAQGNIEAQTIQIAK